MPTYYCPSCWKELPGNVEVCPHCGFALGSLDKLTYEEKLMKAAFHPIPENRYMAVQALGMLRTPRALPVLARILQDEKDDVYLLREVVKALANIPDPHSEELLQQATRHPYRLIRESAARYVSNIKKGKDE